jgi:hypothetical protein
LKPSNTVLGFRGATSEPPGVIRFVERGPQYYALYALALCVAISLWFIAIRSPLWLDETVSFFLIKGGFREIISRQGWPDVPVYSYVLWLWTKATGTGELTLRFSSIFAMLAATYLLYRSARHLFSRDVAVIAAVIFCVHPIIIFASIDVRPYAFGALATTSSILALVHLRHSSSNWVAALFGISAACIVYFQVLFAVILPALAICFVGLRFADRKLSWRQIAIGFVAFALAFLPVIPGLQWMFHTSGTHTFTVAPDLAELRTTLAMGRWPSFLLVGAVLAAAATRKLDLKNDLEGWPILLCTSLALVPVLILYGVSVGTSIHIFLPRYRVIAVPGIALCWALVVSRIDSRALRLLFCVAVVVATVYRQYSSPVFTQHGYSWKYALESVEENASPDNAPVLICSDLPESNFMPMPVGSAVKDSAIFAPLTYYKLSVPVVALPRALNAEAVQIGSGFLRRAAQQQERFFALAYEPSYATLDWIAKGSAGTHQLRELGVFDGIKVIEFIPRAQPDASR